MKEKIRIFFRKQAKETAKRRKKQAKEAAKRRMKYNALKNSDGTKIRTQYFNIPILIIIELIILLFFIGGAAAIKNGEPIFSYDMIITLRALLLIIAPFALLSMLNRFFFGKTVCVINDKGLRLIDDFIGWNEINGISYQPSVLGKRRYYSSSVDIEVCKNNQPYTRTVSVSHFPFYGLILLKRRLPEVKLNLTFMWVMLSIPPAIFLLTALIILLSK